MEKTLNINGAEKFLSSREDKNFSNMQIANVEKTNDLLTSINNVLEKSFNGLEKTFEKIISKSSFKNKNGTNFTKVFQSFFNLKNFFKPENMFKGLKNHISDMMPSLPKYKTKGAAVKDYGKKIFESVKGIGSRLATMGKKAWPYILMGLGLMKRGGLFLVKTLIKGMVSGFKNIILPLVRPITGYLKTLSLKIGSAIKTLSTKIGSFFKSGLSKFKPAVSRVGSSVTKKLARTGLGRAAVGAGARVGLRAGARGAALAAGGGIGSAAVLAAFAAKDLVSNLKNIENVVGKSKENITFGDKIQTIFSSIVETLTFGLVPAKNVFAFIETTSMKIKSFFFNMGAVGQTMLKSFLVLKNTWLVVYEGIWNFIKGIGSEISNIFTSIGDKVSGFFAPVVDKINEMTTSISDFFTEIFEKIKEGATSIFEKISGLFTGTFEGLSKLPIISTILARTKVDYAEVANAEAEKVERERLAKEAEAKRFKEEAALEKQKQETLKQEQIANTNNKETTAQKFQKIKFNNAKSSGQIINKTAFQNTKSIGQWGKPSVDFQYNTSNRSYAPIIETTPKGSVAQTTPAREIDNTPRTKTPTELLQEFLIKDFIPKLATALNIHEDKFNGIDFEVRPLV